MLIHRAAIQADVVSRSILIRVVYGTLEYGAVNHPSTASLAARDDGYHIPTLILVKVSHGGTLGCSPTALQ